MMVNCTRTTRKRSLAKTLTWRAMATLDTFLISLIITDSFAWASSIASIEVLTKMFLYYGHERLWSRFGWGID
ncbi:hypothetical protein P856_666 [Candidatus Endolissoclinum faulkneri L5]|uniref:DUF2061 domain-containing protein n=2 Tax=Candidatus Endolissoclinum faulkneri TaxID=1263979 RepID=V9TSI8_9PROT|nr:hypothetical protein P856_666 [Candidatus Endolissoclinum faulkneri L5]